MTICRGVASEIPRSRRSRCEIRRAAPRVALEVCHVVVEREMRIRVITEAVVAKGRDVLARDHARVLVGVREDAANAGGLLDDADVGACAGMNTV